MTVDPAPYDICVIGGGINGAGIARDAAGRGLRVLLLEKGDLAGATSSASTKLIHGGLRYLEHGDLRLVRESLAEREVLLATAPNLVRPLQIILPVGPGSRPAWMIRTGLFLYDRLGGHSSLPRSKTARFAGTPFATRISSGFEALAQRDGGFGALLPLSLQLHHPRPGHFIEWVIGRHFIQGAACRLQLRFYFLGAS
ncbi:MAG: FAD-dependent oxidoreductase, partial [Proteobacteria bacterium]|nr:FAD-dependent oxidoreductase [Pseudomonadota bacterium]